MEKTNDSTVIDLTITQHNYKQRGLLYLGDITYGPDLPRALIHAMNSGSILGSPSLRAHPNLNPSLPEGGPFFSLYLPAHLNAVIAPRFQVDDSLTPSNAAAQGYRWVEDVERYDRTKGFLKLLDWLLVNWLGEEDYILGAPKRWVGGQGLYEPLSI